MFIKIYVCLCNLGYGNSAIGISPTVFDNLEDAEAFARIHRPYGMQYPVLIGDLLNRFVFEQRTNEFRAMFARLNPNYADNRLLELRDYIRDEWAM